MKQPQRFVTAHAAVQKLFNLGRHLIRVQHYRDLRIAAFSEWSRVGCLGSGRRFVLSEDINLPIPADVLPPEAI